ncbi:MAG: hypothetical protein KA792_07275, partial [Bacteroidales bacterium]|nr:hypothetical protein [Bacteroidales bacterium]
LSFQWYKNDTIITGATDSTLSIQNSTLNDQGAYLCLVSNTCGFVSSDLASLLINIPVQINYQPVSDTAYVGQPASFAVNATGTVLSYQWQQDGVDIGADQNFFGESSPQLNILDVTGLNGKEYRCILSDYNNTVQTSNTAVLSVKDPPENDPGQSNIVNLDKTLPVGTTQGSFDVSPSGAATYTIPILTPPGTAGMVPSVSINYNSQAGNGLLGMGWNLGGLSAITRTGQNPYNDDGNTQGITFTNEDRFALDGNRLILISGEYGVEGSKYRTENEIFSEISYIKESNSNNLYFLIKTKEGKTVKYGCDSPTLEDCNSRMYLKPEEKEDLLIWFITEVQDAKGNYIRFYYDNDEEQNNYRINRIEYTGNEAANLKPYNFITFQYNDNERPDIVFNYIAGNKLISNKRLERINIYNNDANLARPIQSANLVHSYILEYEQYDDNIDLYSQLATITEFGSDGKACNPMIFSYNKPDIYDNKPTGKYYECKDKRQLFCHNWYNASIDIDRDYYFADINGDGKTEIIISYFDSDKQYFTGWGIYKYSDENNKQTINIWGNENNLQDSKPNILYFIAGDYLGEGKSQLIMVEGFQSYTTLNNKLYTTIKYKLSLITQNNSTIEISKPVIPIQLEEMYREDKGYNYFVKFRFFNGNFDADGKSSLLIEKSFTNSAGYQNECELFNKIKILYFLKINKQTTVSIKQYSINTGETECHDILTDKELSEGFKPIIIGDFSGNNRDNVLILQNPNVLISINNSNQIQTINMGDISFYNKIFPGDFNGDGLLDLLIAHPINNTYEWSIKYATGKGFINAPDNICDFLKKDYCYAFSDNTNICRKYSRVAIPEKIFLGDFNGDGRTDIIRLKDRESWGNWQDIHIYYSNGNSFKKLQSNEIPSMTTDYNNTLKYFLQGSQYIDCNGDGKCELIITSKNSATLFGFNYKTFPDRKFYYNYSLKSITNGLGVSTEINYKYLTQSEVYKKGSGASYPVYDVQSPFIVVSAIKTPDNNDDNYFITKYTYEGAKSHILGKGFLGFSKINSIQTNRYSNIIKSTENTFELLTGNKTIPDYYIFAPKEQKIMGTDGTILSDIKSVNAVTYLGNRRIFLHDSIKTETNHLQNTRSVSKYFYTPGTNSSAPFKELQNGNLVRSETKYGLVVNNNFQPNWLFITENKYKYSDYCPWSKIKFTKTIKQNLSNPQYIRTVDIDYNDDFTIKSIINDEGTSNKKVLTVYNYITGADKHRDYFGNPSSTTISSPNASPPIDSRTTEMLYDNKGRFITKTITKVNHPGPGNTVTTVSLKKNNAYEPVYGNILNTSDANNVTINYTYDGFGRLKTQTAPNEAPANYSINFADDDLMVGNVKISYRKDVLQEGLSSQNGQPTITEYYDRSGRLLKKDSKVFDINDSPGNELSSFSYYNNMGQLWLSSSPSKKAGNAKYSWSVFEYDFAGRLSKSTSIFDINFNPEEHTDNIENYVKNFNSSDKTVITYTYEGSTTTTTNTISGQWTKTTTDALGNIVQTEEFAGGKVNYIYQSNGKPRRIVVNSEKIITLDYDENGNQILLNDPDAGVMNYQYNAYNELTKQSDANGNTTELKYDALGRCTNKIFKDKNNVITDNITYTYDISPEPQSDEKCLGLLTYVTESVKNQSFNYHYDNLGRLLSEKQKIEEGQEFTTSYDYYNNANEPKLFGKLKTVTYPSGFTIQKNYSDLGYLSEITRTDQGHTGETIWKALSADNSEINEYSLGANGLVNVKKTTDDFGFNYTVEAKHNNTSLQNFSYSFTPSTGNLYSRKDNNKDLTETFEYDELDRLVTVKLNGDVTNSMQYNTNGNIQKKRDVSEEDYLYKVTQPQVNAVNILNKTKQGLINNFEQDIKWNSFNKIEEITEKDYFGKKTNKMSFVYGISDERTKAVASEIAPDNTEQAVCTKYYAGTYEKEVYPDSIRELHYISSDNGLIAIYV